jgi:parallel beta-helix repeat protein
VKISGFTIRNSGGYKDDSGIKIISDNNIITDCIIYRTRTGIYFENIDNNMISKCLFHTNGEGIFLDTSFNCEIKDSEFCHNAFGSNSQDSYNINIHDVYFHENGIGCFIHNCSNVVITHSAICDNNDNQGGCFIYDSSDISIIDCNIYHNGVGVKLDASSSITIKNCDLSYNSHFTIYAKTQIKDLIISNCNIAHNYRYGIHIRNSNYEATNNNIYDNSIDGIHGKGFTANARYNWWGGLKGPFLTGFRFVDRIQKGSGRIQFFPWRIKPIDDAGSSWKYNDLFTKTVINGYGDSNIALSGDDTDEDGLPDWWEKKWNYDPMVWNDHGNLDPDGDALNNFEECYTDEYGSNPYHKDIFIEFDWMEPEKTDVTNKPPLDLINEMKASFKKHDITLHVDIGNLGGGEELPYIYSFSYDVLRDLYWDFFLHNDLNNPRKNIFHYGLICINGPGPGFAFIGWAHLNAFCISAPVNEEKNEYQNREKIIMTGSMHETGHTLGLFADDFDGNDNRATVKPWYKEFWIYRNYKSAMNYRYTWDMLDYSDGTHGRNDFNDWGNLDYGFFKNTHYTLLEDL